jgi:twinkle protein
MQIHIPAPRHGIPGYYSLHDLPQAGSLREMVMSTGWIELNEIFRPYPEEFVVVTGKPGSGKSTFVLNLLCNLSALHGFKHWLYVPENEGTIVDKMELIHGGSPALYGQFAATRCYVQSSRDEHYLDEPRTIEWILNAAWHAYKADKINTVTIDPWNELEQARSRDESLTDYVGRCLRLVKRFGRETGCIMFIVVHPTKAANEREVRLGDCEGSQHWWNKSDAGLIVTRNLREAKVVVEKIRESPIAGNIGHCLFLVDPQTGRFHEQVGGGVAL